VDLDEATNSFRDDQCLGEGGLGEHDGELFASVTCEAALATQAGTHHPGDLPQHMVARNMATLVVDVLEVIHVEEQHGERASVAPGARELGFYELLEVAAVRNLGQTIHDGGSVYLLVVGGLDVISVQDLEDHAREIQEISRAKRMGDSR
jgi:hypothetical protein